MKRWRCVICGYEEDGDAPPDVCPVCGAASDYFEETAAPVGAIPAVVDRRDRIVVLGAGIAGVAAAEAARAASPNADVILVSAEPDLPYYRLNLTRYLAGEVKREDLWLHPADWYDSLHIQLHKSTVARRIDAGSRTLELLDGTSLEFDRLVLTAGASPFVPPFDGASIPGVICMRGITDAQVALDAASRKLPCAVIGGGILGLEAAGAIARHGSPVTVLEYGPYLLPRQLNARAAGLLADHARAAGIEMCFNARTTGIAGQERAEAVRLDGGALVPAALVVVAAGIRPNVALAAESGLKTHVGIVVDDRMNTSHPDVFAAGDVAEHAGVVYGLWGPAQTQGRVAGSNAAGSAAAFTPVPRSNTLKVLGVGLFSAGEIEMSDNVTTEIESEHDGSFTRFLFRDGRMTGTILLGDIRQSSHALRAMEQQTDFTAVLASHPTAIDILDTLSAS